MTQTHARPGAEHTGANNETSREGTGFEVDHTPIPDGMKRCSTCGEVKPHSEFSRRADRPDGLQSHCKACQAAHYADNPHLWWESRYRTRATASGITPVVKSFTKSELVAEHGDSCTGCGGDWDQLDHVVPVRLGGEHSLGNCRPICDTCHKAKHAADCAAIVAARNGTRAPDADEKICTDCKRVLPRSAFSRDKNRHDGLQPRCRTCQRERDSARRARQRTGGLTPLQRLKRGICDRTIVFEFEGEPA